MEAKEIIEYATLIQGFNRYTTTDTDYPINLFKTKQYIVNMVDKVYANYGKYTFVPVKEELEWDPEKYVPSPKMEVVIELAKVLEMLRYQDDHLMMQTNDLSRLSSQIGIMKSKYNELLKRFNEQQEQIKQQINKQ